MRIFTMWPGRSLLEWRTARFLFAAAALTMAFFTSDIWAQAAVKSSPQHDARLDARNAEGLTPLVAAASAGQAEAVKALLAQGAGVDATAADGRTALIAAAQSGKIEAVQALIAAGANLEWSSRGTGTALNVAENKGETEIVKLLLASGAHTTGKSVGDTVCVRPWDGNGFCGTVKSFSMASVQIQVTKIVGCEHGCSARPECSASRPVGGNDGVQAGEQIAVPSWCLTHTGVKP
jgi:hypothetical protein